MDSRIDPTRPYECDWRLVAPNTLSTKTAAFFCADRRSLLRSTLGVASMNPTHTTLFVLLISLLLYSPHPTGAARLPDRAQPRQSITTQSQSVRVAVFALGSFWRSESVFGCLPGVFRTSVGYAGGSKRNPEYRNLGDHAECVKVEYDPRTIQYNELFDVFWASHDSRQVLGQGPDVGNQYRSIIFTNGTVEARLAATSKEREQAKSRSSVVTTKIQPLVSFYPAESEHQKFELKRRPLLLQLMGNLPEEELLVSTLATKLNAFAGELCSPHIQQRIDSKISDVLRNGWPVLREI